MTQKDAFFTHLTGTDAFGCPEGISPTQDGISAETFFGHLPESNSRGHVVSSVDIVSAYKDKAQGGTKDVTWYVVTVHTETSTWQVTKRFSDFEQLAKNLASCAKNRSVPSLPTKLIIGDQNQQQIEKRRGELEEYVRKAISQCKWAAPVLTSFFQEPSRTLQSHLESNSSSKPDGSPSFPLYTIMMSSEKWTALLDVPGVSAEDLRVETFPGGLRINGNRPSDLESAYGSARDMMIIYDSRWQGRFCFEIAVPSAFQKSYPQVSLCNGVCQISFARSPTPGRDVRRQTPRALDDTPGPVTRESSSGDTK